MNFRCTLAFLVVAAIPSIVCLNGDEIKRPTSQPTSRVSSRLAGRLAAIEILAERRPALQNALKADGMPEPGIERIQWLQKVTRERRLQYAELLRLEPRLRQELMGLWIETGNPAAIPEIKYDELLDHATEIVRNYQNTEEESRNPTVVLGWLKKNISALNGEYSSVAGYALNRVVRFRVSEATSNPENIVPMTPQERHARFSAFSAWYRISKDDLKWNPAERAFERSDGSEFDPP